MKMNRAYVKRLEDLIMQLDATFSDLEAARRKGYLARDMPILHKEADAIRAGRNARLPKHKQT
jgi:hypothetical protein